VDEDNCKIEKNEENDFTLKDIATNENKIYIKKNKNEENIFIFLDETKIEEVKCSSEINLDELRKLSKEMNDNLMFIDKDGLEIDIQDENDFKVKEILIDGKINIKKKNSDNNDNNKDNNKINIEEKKEEEKKLEYINIIVMLDNKQILNLDNIKYNMSLAQIRDLYKDNISENYIFLFYGNKIEKEKEKVISINQIIEKKNDNNYIYILSPEKESNKNEIIINNVSKNDSNINKNNNNSKEASELLKGIENLSIFFNDMINSPELEKKGILNEKKYFNEKYEQFKGIKRLTIPVFGIINAGKSTFLNYLLNLDTLLEIGNDICTQFICIIRNNKDLKEPKLYNVILDFRDEKYVNFLKGSEEKGNIKLIVSRKNREIRESEKERKPNDYFLLIEANIPFLNNLGNNLITSINSPSVTPKSSKLLRYCPNSLVIILKIFKSSYCSNISNN